MDWNCPPYVSVQHDQLTIDNLVHYYPHPYFKRIIDGVSAVQTKPYRSLAGKRLIAKGLLPSAWFECQDIWKLVANSP